MKRLRGFIFHTMGTRSIEVKLTRECINEIATSGDNEPAVDKWCKLLTPYRKDINNDTLRIVLKGFGAWSEEELAIDDDNWVRLIWVAAHDCKEQKTCWDTLEY